MLRAMATTCGALSLAMNSSTIASPQRSSSSVLSQPSGLLNWPQCLQSEDPVSENYNCKKEILRALFSTSSCSGSSGSSSSSSSFRCGSTGISLLFPQMCKEKRVPLAQVRVICFVYLSSFVKLHEKEKKESRTPVCSGQNIPSASFGTSGKEKG